MKKWISALLLVAMLATLLLPASAAGAAFTDITDAATAKNAAVLQMMGVMDGVGNGKFSPNGTLTRAQFCKMTVQIMGIGDQEPLYRNRTVFPDVGANHWARGYINLAVTVPVSTTGGGTGSGAGKEPTTTNNYLIRGNADGTFAPDRAITYAEAVTILMRVLGYTDADAGMIWPKGYIDLGAKVGLTAGLSLTSGQSLSRAQAAQLFTTMLKTAKKGGGAYYTTLGAEVKNDTVLLSANATADDGTLGAMGTSAGIYKTVSGVVPASLVGSRGTLVINSAGKAMAFIPVGDQKTITVGTANAGWITNENGTKYIIPTTAPAYTSTENLTYDKVWMDLRGGMAVTLFFAPTGKINGIYVGGSKVETAMVARQSMGNPFEALLDGAASYTVFRDGAKSTLNDIAQYDVGTYDPTTRILSVSSAKVTGVYENVWPNTDSPSKITIMGAELNVLPMAMEELAACKLGGTITVLLTSDFQVAGVANPSDVKEASIGVVEKKTGANVEVRLINGLKVQGETPSMVNQGDLVQVTSGGVKKLYLSPLLNSSATGTFDVETRKLGSYDLTGSCRFFEKVDPGALVEIRLGDMTLKQVSPSAVRYVHLNASGKVDFIIFGNVTGDRYTYGLLNNLPQDDGSGSKKVQVFNGEFPNGSVAGVYNNAIKKDQVGGLIVPANQNVIAAITSLTEEKGIKRSDFSTRNDQVYVTMRTQEMRVADNVQCYNAVTKTWFKDLADCRAFSDNLTVYYDRPVNEGGKVRLVVAN